MNAHIFELLSPSAISVYHFCSVLSRMAADSAEPAGIHYRQLCINLPPVADHIRPLFGQIMRGKIECFEQSSAVRKDTSATVQAAVPVKPEGIEHARGRAFCAVLYADRSTVSVVEINAKELNVFIFINTKLS